MTSITSPPAVGDLVGESVDGAAIGEAVGADVGLAVGTDVEAFSILPTFSYEIIGQSVASLQVGDEDDDESPKG